MNQTCMLLFGLLPACSSLVVFRDPALLSKILSNKGENSVVVVKVLVGVVIVGVVVVMVLAVLLVVFSVVGFEIALMVVLIP